MPRLDIQIKTPEGQIFSRDHSIEDGVNVKVREGIDNLAQLCGVTPQAIRSSVDLYKPERMGRLPVAVTLLAQVSIGLGIAPHPIARLLHGNQAALCLHQAQGWT